LTHPTDTLNEGIVKPVWKEYTKWQKVSAKVYANYAKFDGNIVFGQQNKPMR